MHKYSGWLVYKQKDAEVNKAFVNMLIAEAKAIDLSLELVFEEELNMGIVDNCMAVTHSEFDCARLDFVIIRSIHPLLTRQFEEMGIRCFNSSRVARICNDKALTYQYASSLGMEMLDSWFISMDAFNAENIPLCFPMVLKQRDGRGGKEVFLVHSAHEIDQILAASPHKQFVLQQFAERPGVDLRVFVIGGKIIGSVLRQSTTSFKANYTLGGRAQPYILSDKETQLVEKISTSLQADFIGIDFLLDRNNHLIFNEIEDVVGCRSLYSTSEVNAAALYMAHVKKTLKNGQH